MYIYTHLDVFLAVMRTWFKCASWARGLRTSESREKKNKQTNQKIKNKNMQLFLLDGRWKAAWKSLRRQQEGEENSEHLAVALSSISGILSGTGPVCANTHAHTHRDAHNCLISCGSWRKMRGGFEAVVSCPTSRVCGCEPLLPPPHLTASPSLNAPIPTEPGRGPPRTVCVRFKPGEGNIFLTYGRGLVAKCDGRNSGLIIDECFGEPPRRREKCGLQYCICRCLV